MRGYAVAAQPGDEWHQILNLLSAAATVRLYASVIDINVVITACGRVRRWRLGTDLLGLLRDRGLRSSLVSFNAASSATERGGAWQQSLRLLAVLAHSQLRADEVSSTGAVMALQSGRLWAEALHASKALGGDLVARSATMKDQLWWRSLHLFQGLRAACEPDAVAYLQSLTSLARRWEKLILLWAQCRHWALSSRAAAVVLGASARSRIWCLALALLAELPLLRLRRTAVLESAAEGTGKTRARHRCCRPVLNTVLFRGATVGEGRQEAADVAAQEADAPQNEGVRLAFLATEQGKPLDAYDHVINWDQVRGKESGAVTTIFGRNVGISPTFHFNREYGQRRDEARALAVCDLVDCSIFKRRRLAVHLRPASAHAERASAEERAQRWREGLLLSPAELGIEANLVFRGASLPRGAWPQVLVRMSMLTSEGLPPNAVILGSGAGSCAKQGEWVRAHLLLWRYLGLGPRFDIVAANAGLGHDWRGALALSCLWAAKGLDRSAATYGALIGACEAPGRWQESLELLRQAERCGAADWHLAHDFILKAGDQLPVGHNHLRICRA
ncbi:unnamed protein product [Symbiodinium natans]|uniref:Pentatricopeptide repeat-containing protein, chloroplastic n=1 Tax=Symbiodinium natans TaxID=878477 RepID=A0A812V5P0_9DINO|nr:unnamed protein product [Symbiodinium natans]